MICYVAHKGDDVVAIGSVDEVADTLGIDRATVMYRSYECNQRKWRENPNSRRLVVDKVEVDE